jgi:hypothetical protein
VKLPPVLRLVVRNFTSNLDIITVLIRFGQPAITIVVLGTMFTTIVSSSATGGTSYTAFLVPGMVAFQMITGGIVSGNLFWLDRRWAMTEQIFSGPFLRSEYLGGLVLTTLLFSLVGVGVMILVGVPFIGLPTLSAAAIGIRRVDMEEHHGCRRPRHKPQIDPAPGCQRQHGLERQRAVIGAQQQRAIAAAADDDCGKRRRQQERRRRLLRELDDG